jgi:hypothetical protein
MADIAKMVARLELEASKFQAGMERAQKQVARFERNTTSSLGKLSKQFSDFGRNVARTFAVGSITAAVYGLSRAIGSAVSAGDDLAKFANKSGLSAEAASRLAHAAKMADVELQGLGQSIRFMQTNLSKIGSSDGEEAKKILDAIGLSAAELKELKPEEQFLAIGDAIKRLPSIESQTRAWQFFGKAGLEVATIFEDGAAGARKMMDATAKVFTASELRRLQEADDAFKTINATVNGVASDMAIGLVNAIKNVGSALGVAFGGTEIQQLEMQLKRTREVAATPWYVPYPMPWIDKAKEDIKVLEDKLARLKMLNSGGWSRVASGSKKGDAPPDFKPEPKKADDLEKLQPIIVTATRIQSDFNQMLKDTETDAQAAARALDVFKIKLEELKAVGLIDESESIARLLASQTEPLLDMKIPEVTEDFKEGLDVMTVYAEQAARNIQDSLAGFFRDFDKGLDGMVEGFLNAIADMAANLAASQLLGMLGGSLSGSTNPFLAALGGALTPKATGGPVSAGGAYMVGERGPEMFVPGASGTIVPNHQLGGGLTYAPVINAQGADASLRAALPGILQDHSRRMLAHIRDQQQRGAM